MYKRKSVLQTAIVECVKKCEHLGGREGLTERYYQLHLGTKSQDISASTASIFFFFNLSHKSPKFMEAKC